MVDGQVGVEFAEHLGHVGAGGAVEGVGDLGEAEAEGARAGWLLRSNIIDSVSAGAYICGVRFS